MSACIECGNDTAPGYGIGCAANACAKTSRRLVRELADILEADGALPLSEHVHVGQGEHKRLWVSNTNPLPATLRARLVELLADAIERELLRRRKQPPEPCCPVCDLPVPREVACGSTAWHGVFHSECLAIRMKGTGEPP